MLHRGTHNTHSRGSWTRLATQLRGLPNGVVSLSSRESSALAHGFFRGHSLTFLERALFSAQLLPALLLPSTLCVFHSHRFSTRHRENLPTDPFGFSVFLWAFLRVFTRALLSRLLSTGSSPTQQSFPGYPLQLALPTAGRPQVLIAKSYVRNPSFPWAASTHTHSDTVFQHCRPGILSRNYTTSPAALGSPPLLLLLTASSSTCSNDG